MANIKRLKVNNITKYFPGVVALDNVSIDLSAGEILSIIGENGAGKSTLMKILSGTYPHGTYTGSLEIDEKTVEIYNALDAERVGLAMIYQELNIQLDMTVAENVMLGRWPKYKNGFIHWGKLKETAREVLASLNLCIDVDIRMRALNASLQQIVCIARALVQNPRILILDEPTAALTIEETENLMSIIRQLKDKGISCIYISHKLDEVFNISDRIVVMRNGQKISEYTRSEIVPERVIEDMIGRRVEQFYTKSQKVFGEEVLKVEEFVVPHPYSPRKNIIDGVSFSVRRGEILGLSGLVGSGRSELLRAIYGDIPKISGKVFVEGNLCKINQPKEAIANGLFMVSEDRKKDGFVGTMSIRHNMTLSVLKKISRFSFINKKVEAEMASKYSKYLSIKAPRLDVSILTLSGGNQQKVIISRALATDMKVLFLDEPTRGIDVGAKAEIYKLINELSEKGLAIVVISSEIPELISVCDRFVVLNNGAVRAEFMKDEVSENKLINSAALIDYSKDYDITCPT